MSKYKNFPTYQEAVEEWMSDHRDWQNNSEDSDEPQAPNAEDWDEKSSAPIDLGDFQRTPIDEANETRPPSPGIVEEDVVEEEPFGVEEEIPASESDAMIPDEVPDQAPTEIPELEPYVSPRSSEPLSSTSINALTNLLFDPAQWASNLAKPEFLALCKGPALQEALAHQSASRLEAGGYRITLPDVRSDLPGAMHFLAYYISGERSHKIAFLQQMVQRLADIAWDLRADSNHVHAFNTYIELVHQNPTDAVLHLPGIPDTERQTKLGVRLHHAQPNSAASAMVLTESELLDLMVQYHNMVPIFAIVLSEFVDEQTKKDVFRGPSEFEDLKLYIIYMLQEISLFMYNALSLAYEAHQLDPQGLDERRFGSVYQWRSEAEQIHGWMKKFVILTKGNKLNSTSALQDILSQFFVAVASSTPAPLMDTPEMKTVLARLDERATRLQTNSRLEQAEKIITDPSLTMVSAQDIQRSSETILAALRTALGRVYSGQINPKDAGGRSWEWLTSHPLRRAETLYALWHQTFFLHAHIPAMLSYLLWKETARGKDEQTKRDAFWMESFYCYTVSKLRMFSPSGSFVSLENSSVLAFNICPVQVVPRDLKGLGVPAAVVAGIKLRFLKSQRIMPEPVWIQRMLPEEHWSLFLGEEKVESPARKKTKSKEGRAVKNRAFTGDKKDQKMFEEAKKEQVRVDARLLSSSSAASAMKGARDEDDEEEQPQEYEEPLAEEEEEEELVLSSKNRKRRVIEAEPEFPWEKRSNGTSTSPETPAYFNYAQSLQQRC